MVIKKAIKKAVKLTHFNSSQSKEDVGSTESGAKPPATESVVEASEAEIQNALQAAEQEIQQLKKEQASLRREVISLRATRPVHYPRYNPEEPIKLPETGVLLFHHLIKTGGTSFNRWLKTCFPGEELEIERNAPEALEDVRGHLEGHGKGEFQIRAVMGHGAHLAIPFFSDIQHISIIRHPVEYAISRYVFDRSIKERNGELDPQSLPIHGDAPLDKVLETILEWGHGPSYNTTANHMTERARLFNSSFSQLINEQRTIKKDQVPDLLDCFDFVGVTNQLPLFCFLLAKHFNLPMAPIGMHNSLQSGQLYFPQWFRDEVEKRAPLDLALYNEACRRLDTFACETFSKLPKSYKDFERYQKQS